MSTMITSIGTILSGFLGWIADIVTSLFIAPGTSDSYADLTVIGWGILIGVVCSLVLFTVKVNQIAWYNGNVVQ